MSSTQIYLLFTFTIFASGVLSFWTLINTDTLFKHAIKNELQRKFWVSALAFTSLYMALFPIFPGAIGEGVETLTFIAFLTKLGIHLLKAGFVVLIPLLIIFAMQNIMLNRGVPLKRLRLYIAITILLSVVITVQLYDVWSWNKISYARFEWTVIWSLFVGCFISAIYLLTNIIHQRRAIENSQKAIKLAKLNELSAKAELTALEAQINPHFLYNALNSISWLAKTDGEKASKMILALAALFRYNVNRNGEPVATIKEEIEILNNYLMIEKFRYEDSLDVEIIVDHALNNERVPKFILQLLVENAIKHGFGDEVSSKIRIVVEKSNETISIKVKDNGQPFPDEIVPGYGLKSIIEKLSILYPGKHCLSFESEPEKQVVVEFSNT